jgi:hypothetical protein
MKLHIALALAVFALTPVTATAETQDEQQACMNDAFSVCGDAIPDRDRVAACLARNLSRISGACRTVMLRYQQPANNVAATRAPAQASKATAHKSKGPLNIKPKHIANRS